MLASILNSPAFRAFVIAVLSSPGVRKFIEDLAVKIVAEIFHRRTTDPEYMAKSNSAFALLREAKNEKETADAMLAIRALASGDSQ